MKGFKFNKLIVLIHLGVFLVVSPVYAEDLVVINGEVVDLSLRQAREVDPLDAIQQRLDNSSTTAVDTSSRSSTVLEDAFRNLTTDQQILVSSALPDNFYSLSEFEQRTVLQQVLNDLQQNNDPSQNEEDSGVDDQALQAILASLLGGGGGAGGQGQGGAGGGDCPNCQGGGSGGNKPPVTQTTNIKNTGEEKNVATAPAEATADKVIRSNKVKVINTGSGTISEAELTTASALRSAPIAEFSGVSKSSILFWPPKDAADPDGARMRTQIPLEMHGSGKFINNLSVDDELFKTSWSEFQAKDYVQRSFMQNNGERDRYLDNFESARGVAHLTLSYLDKTVAAGLSTVQQQADMDYSHQLLKQVSWSTARIANPNRDAIYYDVDEKFQACMMTYGHTGANPRGTQKDNKASFVSEHIDVKSCDAKCKPVADPNTSPYHYCVCCAENASVINTSIAKGGTTSKISCMKDQKCHSLIEKVLVGLELPARADNLGAGGDVDRVNSGRTLANFVSQFRSLYGDIIMMAHEGSSGDFKQVFIHPYLSPATWIKVIRDFETSAADYPGVRNCETMTYDTVQVQYCPALGEVYKEGVCPALFKASAIRKDIEQWEAWMANKESELTSLVVQASGGGVLDVRTIDAIANMDAFIVTQSGQVRVDNPEQLAAINTICDQASAGAFKSIHLKMMSVVVDHLMLNQRVTQHEREQVFNLMNRVSQYLDLAAQDNDSYVRALVAGLNAEKTTNDFVESMAVAQGWSGVMNNKNDFALTPLSGATFGGV